MVSFLFMPLIKAILYLMYGPQVASYEQNQEYEYSIPDPMQLVPPSGRSLDYICPRHRNDPSKFDRAFHKSCDTVWKCFLRAVWTQSDKPFIGHKEYVTHGDVKNSDYIDSRPKECYKFLTFGEVDELVDCLTKSLIQRKLCPVIKSNVDGTPDLKFLGIFSENRKEWYITQIAACSHSIVTVPINAEQQCFQEEWVCKIINSTGMTTLCVSKKTIRQILDLKTKRKLESLKNLILFDQIDNKLLKWATSEGIELLSWQFLIDDGKQLQSIQREEPSDETIIFLGVTSGTTGNPKMAMLTNLNFVSGLISAQ